MEFQAGTSIVAKRATAVVAQTATNASVQNPTDGDGVVVAQGTVDAGVQNPTHGDAGVQNPADGDGGVQIHIICGVDVLWQDIRQNYHSDFNEDYVPNEDEKLKDHVLRVTYHRILDA